MITQIGMSIKRPSKSGKIKPLSPLPNAVGVSAECTETKPPLDCQSNTMTGVLVMMKQDEMTGNHYSHPTPRKKIIKIQDN